MAYIHFNTLLTCYPWCNWSTFLIAWVKVAITTKSLRLHQLNNFTLAIKATVIQGLTDRKLLRFLILCGITVFCVSFFRNSSC